MIHHLKRTVFTSKVGTFLFACTLGAMLASCSQERMQVIADADNAGLVLPDGFSALKVADSIGSARHLVVNTNGDIFVKLQRAIDGKGVIMLSDSDGDGRADEQVGFGDYGGTGIFIKDDFLYASSDSEVFRYALDPNERVVNPDAPDTIITGLIDRRQHNSKSIALDDAGNIYVNIGAFSNVCQEQDRTPGSPGMSPCPILDSAGGIWQFRADGIRQSYGEGERYATGLRNVVGLDWNQQAGALFVMQHGRDNLHDFYPELYGETGIELPSEAMYRLSKGADAGWPYIYYDHLQKKKIINPEYGGDGKLEGDTSILDPVVAFPSHIAPNAMLFYTGDMFPEKYKNGAFVAFHGSWNRAPQQQGYLVAFVPFDEHGQPTGDWEVFADGFAGVDNVASPGDALHRPCGLAQGPDGSLYVSDSVNGTIYRIVYAANN